MTSAGLELAKRVICDTLDSFDRAKIGHDKVDKLAASLAAALLSHPVDTGQGAGEEEVTDLIRRLMPFSDLLTHRLNSHGMSPIYQSDGLTVADIRAAADAGKMLRSFLASRPPLASVEGAKKAGAQFLNEVESVSGKVNKRHRDAFRAALAQSGRSSAEPVAALSLKTDIAPETKAALDAIDDNIRNAAQMAPGIFVGSATPPADSAEPVADNLRHRLWECLRFGASRSVISSAEEQAILDRFDATPPVGRREAQVAKEVIDALAALEPFAKIAGEYSPREDDDFNIMGDKDVLGEKLTLRKFRRARDARLAHAAYLSALTPPIAGAGEEPKDWSEIPNTQTDDAHPINVLAGILLCAESWVPEARIIGNVRAGDIARAIRSFSPQFLASDGGGV